MVQALVVVFAMTCGDGFDGRDEKAASVRSLCTLSASSSHRHGLYAGASSVAHVPATSRRCTS
ncbi:LOW QUALITY PROTEIN: hypothetical protein Q4I28_006167 [Leishmania naiffi]|uniref:Secreted protein n=1 Tax=Leishmania naiffi TaxID=5678 RepID=A0AAW3BFI9_9TRYP